MLRSPFFWKLYGGYVALICAAALVVGIVVSRWVVKESLAETERELERIARVLEEVAAPALAAPHAGPDAALEAQLRRMRVESGARLTVIAADGTVVADSDEDPASMENHLWRREIVAAREKGEGTDARESRTLGIRMMYAAYPVRAGAGIRGYVRTALPLTVVESRVAAVRRTVLAGGGIAAAAALLAALLFTQWVTGPLRAVTRAVGAFAAGDYGRRARIRTTDEIGRLARTFDEMADELERRMAIVQRERNQLLATLEGMVEGVVAVDGAETVVNMNEAAGAMLGTDAHAGVGRPVWEVTRIREVSEILGRSLSEGKPVTGELRLPAGHTDRVIAAYASPLAHGGGGGAVLVLHDVTELVRLERVRRDFVANVSHELKTPLAAIRGLVETVEDDDQMPAATRRDFLGRIREQSRRLAEMVTDLLALSRVESGEQVLERRLLDLREPMSQACAGLRRAADEKGLALEVAAPESPLHVRGDADALRQLVANLLDNAIKYTASGGRIRVRARAEGGSAILEVEDTGVGIEAAEQERVFERFYRVDKARSRELGGTGLGLSIVKHTAQAMGGRVSVSSVPGQGSTFRVVLPLASPSTAA